MALYCAGAEKKMDVDPSSKSLPKAGIAPSASSKEFFKSSLIAVPVLIALSPLDKSSMSAVSTVLAVEKYEFF